MTRSEMLNKLDVVNGVGVVAAYDDGSRVAYLYEDFADNDKGIDRAIEQMMSNPRITFFTVYKKEV